MPKLTIIVPVYKTERYILRCLESISTQTFRDWECLLIDDGSPDNCGEICDEYVMKDKRFRTIHKENGGVSSARNLGLDNAQGEWITFIDSDDFVASNYLTDLISPITSDEELDFVHCGCLNWQNEKIVGINQNYEYYVGEDPAKLFREIRGLPFSKLFRLSIINGIGDGYLLRFDEKMKIAEDMAFTLDYILRVKRYSFVSGMGYYYRIDNLDSATHKCIQPYNLQLISYRHIANAVDEYLSKFNLSYSDFHDRMVQRGEQLASVIRSLYIEEKKSDVRLSMLKGDFMKSEFKYFDYLKPKSVKRIIYKILGKGYYRVFNCIMTIIY